VPCCGHVVHLTVRYRQNNDEVDVSVRSCCICAGNCLAGCASCAAALLLWSVDHLAAQYRLVCYQSNRAAVCHAAAAVCHAAAAVCHAAAAVCGASDTTTGRMCVGSLASYVTIMITHCVASSILWLLAKPLKLCSCTVCCCLVAVGHRPSVPHYREDCDQGIRAAVRHVAQLTF
jgi:hypothetical protein